MSSDPVDAFLERHPLAVADAECVVSGDLVAHRLFRDTPPPRLGSYQLLERVGGGGMGTVFRARDQHLDRDVAIKFVRHTAPAEGEGRRLQREARALARVNDPNVVAIHEVNEDEALGLYLVMEFVDGITLGRWVTAGARTMVEIAEKLLDACRGLMAAHEAGIVHRDLKPDNVLVARDGSVRVADFGLARAREGVDVDSRGDPRWPGLASTLTRSGPAGTRGYVAPERFEGRPPDVPGDVFSFCVTAWELLAGERPFANPPPRAALALPAVLRPALLAGLRRDPGERSPSLAPIFGALEQFVGTASAAAPRSRWWPLVGAALIFAVGFAAAWGLASRGGDKTTAVPDAAPTERGPDVAALLGAHVLPGTPPSPSPLGSVWPPTDSGEGAANIIEVATPELAGDGAWRRAAISEVRALAGTVNVDAVGVRVLPYADRRLLVGASPEAVGLRDHLAALVAVQREVLPGAAVVVTEFGFDTDPNSRHRAGTGTDLELAQARWLMRCVLEMAAAGVGRAYVHAHRDRGAGSEVGMTSGLVSGETPARPRLAWYFLATLREHLGAMGFVGEVDVGLADVRAYRFRESNVGGRAVVVWSGTTRDRVIDAVGVPFRGASAMAVVPARGEPQGQRTPLEIVDEQVRIRVTETPTLILEASAR